MSDGQALEAPVVEVQNAEPGSNSLDDVDDPKLLKAEIKKLRAENAGARVKNKEVEGKLSEYDKWKASQQTELERTVAEKEKLLKENKALIRENLVTKYKVPEDLVDFVDGETKDEMEERAKRLGGRSTAVGLEPAGGNAVLFGGDRGIPVGKKDESGTNAGSSTGGAFLKALWDGKVQ